MMRFLYYLCFQKEETFQKKICVIEKACYNGAIDAIN